MMKIKLMFAAVTVFAVTMQSCSKDDEVQGCTDAAACNFEATATEDNGSCSYAGTWYQDLDGDGQGNPTVSVSDCVQPTGYVSNSNGSALSFNQTAVPIMYKITGETCYYCGDWGWQAWIDLADDFAGTAFRWSNYGTGFSTGNFRGQELDATNNVADAIENMFEVGSGKPNFATNTVDYSTSTTDAKTAATAALLVTADVGAAFTASIDGNTLTLKAGAKFFAAATGEYWLGAYVVENNVNGAQSGPIGANGPVDHHFVMRGSMSNSPWGVQIAASGAASGDILEETFSIMIPGTYNQANLSYGVIVWKKTGSTYEYVNAYTNQQ